MSSLLHFVLSFVQQKRSTHRFGSSQSFKCLRLPLPPVSEMSWLKIPLDPHNHRFPSEGRTMACSIFSIRSNLAKSLWASQECCWLIRTAEHWRLTTDSGEGQELPPWGHLWRCHFSPILEMPTQNYQKGHSFLRAQSEPRPTQLTTLPVPVMI